MIHALTSNPEVGASRRVAGLAIAGFTGVIYCIVLACVLPRGSRNDASDQAVLGVVLGCLSFAPLSIPFVLPFVFRVGPLSMFLLWTLAIPAAWCLPFLTVIACGETFERMHIGRPGMWGPYYSELAFFEWIPALMLGPIAIALVAAWVRRVARDSDRGASPTT
jgi:hypothetical protein